MQTTSNSTHSPNIFIGNENTPHICSQIHISACVCISVRYKVSQTVQLTAGVKNLTHTPKKKNQTTFNSAHSPYMYISIKKTPHICSQTHINAYKCISVHHKSACQHTQRSKKFGPFSAKNLTRNASYGPDDFFTSRLGLSRLQIKNTYILYKNEGKKRVLQL